MFHFKSTHFGLFILLLAQKSGLRNILYPPRLCVFLSRFFSFHEYDVCSMDFCDEQWMRLSKSNCHKACTYVFFKDGTKSVRKRKATINMQTGIATEVVCFKYLFIFFHFFISFDLISISVSQWAIKTIIIIMFSLQLYLVHFDKITLFNYSFN